MSNSQRYSSLQAHSQSSRTPPQPMVQSPSPSKAPEATSANAPHRPHSGPSSHLHQRWFSSLLLMIQTPKLTSLLPRRNARGRTRTSHQSLTVQNSSTQMEQSACALTARQPRHHSGGKVHVGLKRYAMPVESGSGQAVFFRSTVHRQARASSQACIRILTGRS